MPYFGRTLILKKLPSFRAVSVRGQVSVSVRGVSFGFGQVAGFEATLAWTKGSFKQKSPNSCVHSPTEWLNAAEEVRGDAHVVKFELFEHRAAPHATHEPVDEVH